MEESKTLNTNEKPTERIKNNGDWGGGSCPFWIIGDENSAKNDLKEKFEVIDDAKKD